MKLDGAQLLGLATFAIVALIILGIGLRRQPRPVWLFAFGLVVVGLGYLATTNAPTEFARTIYGEPG